MAPKQLGIPFSGAGPNFPASPAGTTDRKPMLDPITKLYLVRVDVRAGIAGMEEITECLLRLGFRPVHGLGETPAVDAIAKPPRIPPASVNSTLTVSASSSHR